MAGHSKFKNIMHRKGAQDAKRAKIFTRVGREIMVAVKTGGGPDPDGNPALRSAIQSARAVNMPKDKVEAAIKRASGRDATNYETVIYEGYAPHGIALLVETATDNPTRTVATVRNIITKNGGNLGTNGSVSFMFRKMGVFRLDPAGIDQDDAVGERRALLAVTCRVVDLSSDSGGAFSVNICHRNFRTLFGQHQR